MTQSYVVIQRDNEEFANRHRIWVSSDAPWSSFAMAPRMPYVSPLDLVVQHCMRYWPEYETLCGHKNDPALLTHDVFAGMPCMHVAKEVFTRDGTGPLFRALHAVGAKEVFVVFSHAVVLPT